MIKIPFKAQELPQKIGEEFESLHQSENWDELIEFIEEYLDRVPEARTETEAVVLCLGYAKIMAAISIYVDDVIDTAKEVSKLIDSIESPSTSAERFKKQIRKILNTARKRDREIARLNNKPIEQLSDDEMSELAFQLDDKGGRDNAGKAAQLHRILMDRKNHPADKFYRLGSYALALERSGKHDEADKVFRKVFSWRYDRGVSAYPYFIDYAFYAWLDRYEQDPVKFHEIWRAALGNEVISRHREYFPFAEPVQDKLLATAFRHELPDVCSHLVDVIKDHRHPRSLSEATKLLMGKVTTWLAGQ